MREGWEINFSFHSDMSSSNSRVAFVPGQNCYETIMELKRPADPTYVLDSKNLVFSLEDDGTISALFMRSELLDLEHSNYVDRRLMYMTNNGDLLIALERPILFPMPPGTAAYDLEIFQTTYIGPSYSQGDDEFVIFTDYSGLLIGGFDEAWKPLGVMVETQALPASDITDEPRIYRIWMDE